MEQVAPPSLENEPSQHPEPLTATQVYERLGDYLKESPAAGAKPLFLAGEGYSYNAWGLSMAKDGNNEDVVWLATDAPTPV